jgi:hypothetical protein
MQTPTRTMRRQARWLGLALVALAIAAPAANAGPGRLDIYPYESPYGVAAGGTALVNPLALARRFSEPVRAGVQSASVNPLAGRLHIYPYETPFGPEVLRPAASSSQPARGLLQGSGASTATSAVNHFDRLDAAIGAVAGLGLALVAVLSALAVRRRRDHVAITARGRRRLARSLARAAVPERRFLGRGPRYIVHPNVALPCAPALRAIATALRDEALALDEDGLRAVRTFITDAASSLFGREPTDALREAVRLQYVIVGTEMAALDQEPIAIAV